MLTIMRNFAEPRAVRTAPIPISYATANSTYGTIPRSVELLQKMQVRKSDNILYTISQISVADLIIIVSKL